jgi:SAM-dependent methyltransferase
MNLTHLRETLLYTDLAAWWPVLSAPADYAEEAAFYRRLILEACPSLAGAAAPALLELGSGGGNNASHLKATFRMTLVDRAPGMLAVSRALNPECEHIQGDMRTVRLGRTFDAVFTHDAISYMTSKADLRQAMETAFVHCKPGGVALFCPDCLRETFRPTTDHGGHDSPDGRALRYLEWTWDPDPADSTCITDFAYLLREADGSLRVFRDRHVCGLFSRADWLRLMTEVGFDGRGVPFEHSEVEAGLTEVFVGRRAG